MSPDRLSPLDTSFLHIEDHVSHMHIASVAIFEGPPPPFADIVAMVDAKLDLVPRYRQKVRLVPLELGRPVWVDDPHFNIEYHLRHTALPAPGGESDLRKLVGRVMAQQLDRSRPLWEIWVVEGLEDGRWAVLAKTHHALVDGVSGTDLLAVIMDRSPDAERPEPSGWTPHPEPSGLQLVVDALENIVRSPYEQLRADPGTGPRRAAAGRVRARGGEGLLSLSGLVRPTPLSSLNGPLGPHRRYAWATTSVDDIKRVRRALGGHLQRRRVGQHHQWVPRAPALARRGRRARSCARWCPSRSGPATRPARRWVTGPSRTGCRRCSPSSRSTSRTRCSGSTPSPSR